MPSTDATNIPGLPDLTKLPGENADAAEAAAKVLASASQKKQGEEVAVTSAAEWRKKRKEGFVVTLPSGNNAKVARKIDLLEAMRDGSLPNALAAIVSKMISGENISADLLTQDTLLEMMAWIDEQVITAMIEPQVVRKPSDAPKDWEPPEGCIELADLEISDRMFLAGVAQGGPAQFERFREQSVAALEASQLG